MSQEDDAEVFRQATRHWNDGNFDGVLALIADDIVHDVNIDALRIPWVSSAKGKPAVEARLRLIAATFIIDAFIVERFVFEEDQIRATVLGYHTHRATGERLDVKLRFKVRVQDGLIVRLEEFLDAPYFGAFQRFVSYLEETAKAAKEMP